MQTKNILVNKQEGLLTENTLVISEKFCRLKTLWTSTLKVSRLKTFLVNTPEVFQTEKTLINEAKGLQIGNTLETRQKFFRLKTFWSTTRKGLQNDIILVILQIKITLVSKQV